jgi:phosphatidylinositol-3-phosphatase
MMRKTAFILVAGLAACGGGGGGGGDHPDGNQGSDSGSGSDGTTGTSTRTIFTIVLENHDYNEIVGSANAPYINSLIAMGALATNYKDTIHPSLGNYLHMISGDNQYPGVIDVGPQQIPYFPADKPNLGQQLSQAGIKWRAYQETMGTACNLKDNGKYAPKHNPFIYFKSLQGTAECAQVDVDYSNFAADLATNQFRFMWITPNLDSDGHDPSGDPVAALKHSDMWMSQEVPKILDSEGFKSGGVLFVTWDEAEGRNGNDADKIPMIVLSPRIKQAGMQGATALTHSSYLATVEELLGLSRLATVTSAATMMDFLNP